MSPQSSIFVDTSGWAAPVVANVPNQVALATYSPALVRSGRTLVTTNYIITELVALLTIRTRLTRPQIIQFTNQVKRIARIIHIDPTTDADAWALPGAVHRQGMVAGGCRELRGHAPDGPPRSFHDRPSLRAGWLDTRASVAAIRDQTA